HGTVAFISFLSGGAGIFTRSRLLVQTGNVIGGKTFTQFESGLKMNDSGTLAFIAGSSFPFGPNGVFTQSASVLYSGDTLAGKTVQTVAFPAINNKGHIAFRAIFTDGTMAIVLARPKSDDGEDDDH